MIDRPAPGFNLPCVAEGAQPQRAGLNDYRGQWLALVFYPRDYSLVCPTELTALGDRIEAFRELDCALLGVSCDPVAVHRHWLATPAIEGGLAGLPFPLASDEDGAVSKAYGVYQDPPGVSLRGLFLIDPHGRVQYQVVHNLSVGRRADEVLRVLGGLQSGGMCPHGWKPGETILDPTEILGPGRVVAHYRIEDKIGEGTFAAVFRAFDETLRRTVALKVFKPKALARPRAMLDEARAAAALNHPNICIIYAVDDSEGVPMIAMEHLSGQPLDRLSDGQPVPVPQALVILRQVASAMAAAHEAGVIHGDLKPQNVLIDEAGWVKIVDFGLARRTGSAIDPLETAESHDPVGSAGITGTPGYLAPEQTRGEPASTASDVFAFGIIIFELLTGQRAFAKDNILRVLESIRSVDPEALAEAVEPPFDAILKQAMAADPQARDLSMRAIAEWLEDVPMPVSNF